ncbi:MAG: heterodisulfide reductase [Desulfobacteraceae bacterium]|jgi:quinone-modifying oxidoreductase subunit QmoC|nr:MAG: heterodisulfide reductase [Desulfobacteraceae bacterium]
MADKYLVEPDVGFIKELGVLGGDSLKKCFQCATCSVVCPISPDTKPFPRKEMIAASWGLKDKLIGNGDIWLCHNCGDCSTKCPRGAKPGDVLSAIRMYAIGHYGGFPKLGALINDPKKLPVVAAIPAVLFLVIGMILKMFGIDWLNFSPERVYTSAADVEGHIAHAQFFSTWLVDLIFVPLSIWVVAVFALGLKRFVADIHANALAEKKTDKQNIDPKEFVQALIRVIPTILKHKKFSECTENDERATPHMMVFFSFIGLAIVTGIFFVVLYVFGIHGPYSQINPVKILANVSGIALILGGLLMIKNRLDKKEEQQTTYKDWFLIGLVLGLGVTGMLAQLTRLADAAFLTYLIYYIHLMFVFVLFMFLPFSKLAHLVYRTVAMAYNEYAGRK